MDDGTLLHTDLRDRLMRIVSLKARPSAPPDDDVGGWIALGWPPAPERARDSRREQPAAARTLTPDLAGLAEPLRKRLTDEWLVEGLYEHASIAWFSRLSLGLLAAGAPTELVLRTYDAAGDEARHTELCFALASAYRGEPASASNYPFEEAEPIAASMGSLAAIVFEQGCIGETLVAVQVREELLRAEDAAVCATLEQMAGDESRHAELCWEILAWTINQGGAEVARAVGDLLGRASWVPDASDAAPAEERRLMMAHGRLDPLAVHALQARALRTIVVPCAQRLLSRPLADGTQPSGRGHERSAVWRRS
jgi:hypothetical protein